MSKCEMKGGLLIKRDYLNAREYPQRRVLIKLNFEDGHTYCCGFKTERDDEFKYLWHCSRCKGLYIGPKATM
jgi:hypothetical protein